MAFFATALDTVDAKRWSYMAQVLASALEDATSSSVIVPGRIPIAVLASARRFFNLALAVRGGGPSAADVQASVANYRIAADALRASAERPPASREQLEEQLHEFAELLPRLGEAGVLSEEEVRKIKELQRFFLQIAADGVAEDYQRYARSANGSFRSPLG
jgi:uncharacterized protein with GYD domain